jgi:hypothetical protein
MYRRVGRQSVWLLDIDLCASERNVSRTTRARPNPVYRDADVLGNQQVRTYLVSFITNSRGLKWTSTQQSVN